MEDPSTYSVKEFFHDTSFEDYDIRWRENFDKAVKEEVQSTQRKIAGAVIYYLGLKTGDAAENENNIKIENFRQHLKISVNDVIAILRGEYPLDLKLICQMEDYLNVELIRIAS